MTAAKMFCNLCRRICSTNKIPRKQIALIVVFYLICILTYTQLSSTTENEATQYKEPKKFGLAEKLNDRKHQLQKACSESTTNNMDINFNFVTNSALPWLFISKKYNLVYCQVPKIGSTNWLKLLGVMEGKLKNVTDNIDIHKILLPALYFRNETQRKIFPYFTSFMVVRDPIQRLISAYKDKLVPPPGSKIPTFSSLARGIIEIYRPRNQDEGNPVNFPTLHEFVQFITDTKSNKINPVHQITRHWMSQTQLCYPCNIDYKFVLKISNIEEEAEFILKTAGVPPSLRYPKQVDNSVKNRGDIEENSAPYMKLNALDYKALCHYYEDDFEILGFEYPPECS